MSEDPKFLIEAFVAIGYWCDDPDGTDEDLRGILREAQASARDDALEEAADSATKFLVGDPFNGVPLRSPGPHEVAAHIRKLKSKG